MIKIEHNIIGMCATNTYYIFDDVTKKGIIIDPAGDAERIIARVAKLDFEPMAIFITHGHFDHVLALDEVRDNFKIKAYAGINEEKVFHSIEKNLTADFTGMGRTFDADVYLNDGEEFKLGDFEIKVFEVPGHTIGSLCYYFKNEGVIFTGDTLFAGSVGRTDFPGGSASSLINAIREKLLPLPGATVCYPGHGENTTIEYEKKYNSFLG